MRQHWYCGFSAEELKRYIKSLQTRFRSAHTKFDSVELKNRHADDRHLVFCPAANEVCHGVSHPTGGNDRAFLGGRFRFGAALFPGHHYEVGARSGNLSCTLYDEDGCPRNMAPEKREYINIFPNDHLLPLAP